MIAGVATVVRVDSISMDLVVVKARKAIEDTDESDLHTSDEAADDDEEATDGHEPVESADERAKVISLHTRCLPADARLALPDMSKYGRLLLPVKNITSTRKGASAWPPPRPKRPSTGFPPGGCSCRAIPRGAD